MNYFFIQIAIFSLIFCKLISADNVDKQKELTIKLKAGETTCFYESIQLNRLIDIEYQVIDGSYGELDISFEIRNPHGHIIETDYKRSDNIHRISAHVEGDYGFCFDNAFSIYSGKTVFFELIVEYDENDKAERHHEFDEFKTKLSPDTFDLTQEKIHTMYLEALGSTENIHDRLNEVKHHLDIRRSTEARDRNLAEANNFRVGAWSSFQIILMCIVGSIQVYMLRSLFETDRRNNIWYKFLKR